ncbi:3-isopropylmalate dehydratase large subunit [Caldanaerobacter sp.]|uniref:3-isopropylmalate dehydratase large subunit n=1 Tax=Caldanaerobacter sp. TaxID=2930036 RepID=UPI003C768D47
MGLTLTQKILSAKAGKEVKPGELIEIDVDMVLGNDITAPVAIKEFEKIGVDKVFDNTRIALVPDHFVPSKDIKSAEQVNIMRKFAKKYNIVNFFEVGRMGIEHALLPEQGLVLPGDVVIGADSHTCTYGALTCFATGVGSTDMAAAMATGKAWFKVPEAIKFVLKGNLGKWVSGKDVILYIIGKIGVDGALYKSMEFTGNIKALSMDDRFTIANMAIEAGAKNGIFDFDEITEEYVRDRAKRDYRIFERDEDAEYSEIIEVNLEEIRPQVALPHLPENTVDVDEINKKIKVDQVVIGSCTNGRLSDMEIAYKILKGKKVHPDVRLIIFPATQEIYLECVKRGYIEEFIKAGAAVSTPTCGPCLGGHMGVLAKGERAIATTNRNFVGRMGHPESEVYLASPAVAAASAVAGYIVSPEEVE